MPFSKIAVACVLFACGCGGTPVSRDSGAGDSRPTDARGDTDSPRGDDGTSEIPDGAPAPDVEDAPVTDDVPSVDAIDAPVSDGDTPPADADASLPADADASLPGDADTSLPGDADASLPGDAVPDGGGGEVSARPPRALSLVVYNAPWKGGQRVAGMAVDAQNRIYLEDHRNVYLIEGKTVSTYLTLAETTARANMLTASQIMDLDLGPDGLLYVLIWTGSTSIPTSTHVVRSPAAHVADPWLDLTSNFATRVAVFSAGNVGVTDRDGFKMFSSTGAGQLVYKPPQFRSGGGCAAEDLVAAPSGVFLYQPGCNGAPILRGNVDGSGVGTLYEAAAFKKPTDTYTPNFICATRDPRGGFYFTVGQLDYGSPRLFHITEDASGQNGLEWIETLPSFVDAAKTQSEVFAFDYCSLAAAADGTVFFQTYSQLWKVAP